MRALALLVIAAGLAWSGWWFWQSHLTRQAIEDWFEARRADGWTAEYDDLSVRGFPNRIDVTLTEPRLAGPDGGIAWQAPSLKAFQLVYNPNHLILNFADDMQLGETRIASDGFRASLRQEDGRIVSVHTEAAVLNVDGPQGALALAGLTAAMETVEAQDKGYRLGLVAQQVAGPVTTPGKGDGLQLQATVQFDRPWRMRDAPAERPQPTEIDLRLLQYQLGEAQLQLAGTLDIDDRGRGDGGLTLRAERWRALLDMAREDGQLPRAVLDTIEDGLALYTRLTGSGDRLDLPLKFEDGKVSMGPIPLGDGLRFRLP